MCVILAPYSIQAVYDSVFEPENIGSFAFVPMNKNFHRVSVGRHQETSDAKTLPNVCFARTSGYQGQLAALFLRLQTLNTMAVLRPVRDALQQVN